MKESFERGSLFCVYIGQSGGGWNPLFYDESSQDEIYNFYLIDAKNKK